MSLRPSQKAESPLMATVAASLHVLLPDDVVTILALGAEG